MKKLLKKPAARPTTSPKRIAAGSGIPAWNENPIATETRASAAPTERSIPPVMMMSVMPSAMRPTSTKKREVLRAFRMVRNASDVCPKKTMRPRRTKTRTSSRESEILGKRTAIASARLTPSLRAGGDGTRPS
jgi:hypothetical protein